MIKFDNMTSQWQQQEYLNKGSYAQVYRVKYKGNNYALKKIYPYLLTRPQHRQIVQRQIAIMSQIDHPNIIKFYKAIVQEEEISILLEFASGGSLYDQLKIYKKLPQQHVKKFVKDIIQALEYLHYRNNPILHRDIKPQNLLIDAQGNCKLADFGTANILDGQRYSYVGTKQYMAPQMEECRSHGIQIDIWAMGVLIYELLVGQTPKQIPFYPSYISRPAEDVIKKLLNKDQMKRMTLKQLKNHIWLFEELQPINILLKTTPQRSKLSLLKQNLNKKLSSNGNKLFKKQSSTLLFQKQRSNFQQNQQLNKMITPYFDLLKQRNRLRIQYKINERKIQKQQRRRMIQRPYLLQEIQRLKNQIKQYESNIQVLNRKPLKMQAQCRMLIKSLIKRIQELSDYVKSCSSRTQAQLLQFSGYEPLEQVLPINQYIFKLKIQMLTHKRDSLNMLLVSKKIYANIQEMIKINNKDYSFQEKQKEEEYLEKVQSSISFIDKKNV